LAFFALLRGKNETKTGLFGRNCFKINPNHKLLEKKADSTQISLC